VFLLFLIIVLGDIVAMIPMAALVGVMIMVSISTFEWHSIRQMKKLSLSSNIEMLATMAIVLVTDNLAYGVIAGIAISAINFAWKIADVNVKEHLLVHDNQEYKIYRITGQLFFASTLKFSEMFNFADDPDNIIVDFKNSHVWDHSAVEALSKVKERYNKLNKEIHIVGLNKESSDIVLKLYEDMAV
jgi:SulP family sulfate permease